MRHAPAAEDRRAEAVTVAWTLCVMATLLAEVTGGSVRLVTAWIGGEQLPQAVRILPGLMLFSAVLTGALSLFLLPFVYRFRRTPPPSTVTVCAVGIAVVPFFVFLWNALA